MSSIADRRDTQRVIVGPEFAISFLLKGHSFKDVRITNISQGGCFALINARDARLFMRGATLENLVLEHPELPKSPIIATVSYVLGGGPGQEAMDLVGVGIQFLSVDAEARAALLVWIEAAILPEAGETPA
jgi:hypothetical protein